MNYREKTESLKKELSLLIAQHDELLFHVCPMLKNEYNRVVGNLEIRVNNRRLDVAKTARRIELYRNSSDGQRSIIDAKLDSEYADAYKPEQYVYEEYQLTSEGEDEELVRNYVILLERLHPLINPNTFENRQNMYEQARNCFYRLDRNGLQLLLNKSDNCNTEECGDIYERFHLLSREKEFYLRKIDTIKNSFPYDQIELILDHEKLSEKAAHYQEVLDRVNEQYESLKSFL